MWTKPRTTIQQIVDTNPERLVLILVAIAGFSLLTPDLHSAGMKSWGDRVEWPIILVVAAIAGPIGGIIGLYIGGAIIRWTGKWIGGQASSQNVRAAIAWSSVPMIWALVVWVHNIAYHGQALFTTETPIVDANPSLAFGCYAISIIEITVYIWAFVVFLKCLGQVQGFSAWKALGNTILAGLVIIVTVAVVNIAIEF